MAGTAESVTRASIISMLGLAVSMLRGESPDSGLRLAAAAAAASTQIAGPGNLDPSTAERFLATTIVRRF